MALACLTGLFVTFIVLVDFGPDSANACNRTIVRSVNAVANSTATKTPGEGLVRISISSIPYGDPSISAADHELTISKKQAMSQEEMQDFMNKTNDEMMDLIAQGTDEAINQNVNDGVTPEATGQETNSTTPLGTTTTDSTAYTPAFTPFTTPWASLTTSPVTNQTASQATHQATSPATTYGLPPPRQHADLSTPDEPCEFCYPPGTAPCLVVGGPRCFCDLVFPGPPQSVLKPIGHERALYSAAAGQAAHEAHKRGIAT